MLFVTYHSDLTYGPALGRGQITYSAVLVQRRSIWYRVVENIGKSYILLLALNSQQQFKEI